MDAFVQMIRNAMCCVKDFNLFDETLLHDPSHTALYYKFPEPLDKTTPLEVLIGMTQFYAFVSVSVAGYHLITGPGLGKLRRVTRLVELRSKARGTGITDKIVNDSLSEEGSAAIRSIWTGVNVLGIGLSFFWLFANSFHVTETDWIGGLQGLIHALTVMEICLVPLLYFMIKDGSAKIAKSARMNEFSKKIVSCEGNISSVELGEELLNAETYGWIQKGGWSPFWSESAPLSAGDSSAEGNMLAKEVGKVQYTVSALLADKKNDDKNVKVVHRAAEEASESLLQEAGVERLNGNLEYLYFVLNFIAFYGYLLGVICFYYDDDDLQGTYTGSLKLGMSNADADWHGNFAGDFMWTIEPIFILGSPRMIGWLKPQTKKMKAD